MRGDRLGNSSFFLVWRIHAVEVGGRGIEGWIVELLFLFVRFGMMNLITLSVIPATYLSRFRS